MRNLGLGVLPAQRRAPEPPRSVLHIGVRAHGGHLAVGAGVAKFTPNGWKRHDPSTLIQDVANHAHHD